MTVNDKTARNLFSPRVPRPLISLGPQAGHLDGSRRDDVRGDKIRIEISVVL